MDEIKSITKEELDHIIENDLKEIQEQDRNERIKELSDNSLQIIQKVLAENKQLDLALSKTTEDKARYNDYYPWPVKLIKTDELTVISNFDIYDQKLVITAECLDGEIRQFTWRNVYDNRVCAEQVDGDKTDETITWEIV